jgi:DNA-binding LytR/AlgR family response regulator
MMLRLTEGYIFNMIKKKGENVLKKIWVCDDNEGCLAQIDALLRKTLQQLKEEAEIVLVKSGKELLNMLVCEHEWVDIIFLDIEMPEINGFKVARQLDAVRQTSLLVFMSSYDEFILGSFEYEPFRFIQKSHIETQILPVLRAAFTKLKGSGTTAIVVKTDEYDEVQIYLSEIKYIEKQNRRLAIYYDDNKVAYSWKSIKQMMELTAGYQFVRIHNSCIVNPYQVKAICKGKNMLELYDGRTLAIGRGRLTQIRRQLTEAWGEQV